MGPPAEADEVPKTKVVVTATRARRANFFMTEVSFRGLCEWDFMHVWVRRFKRLLSFVCMMKRKSNAHSEDQKSKRQFDITKYNKTV
jgi:hypothetical protein